MCVPVDKGLAHIHEYLIRLNMFDAMALKGPWINYLLKTEIYDYFLCLLLIQTLQQLEFFRFACKWWLIFIQIAFDVIFPVQGNGRGKIKECIELHALPEKVVSSNPGLTSPAIANVFAQK